MELTSSFDVEKPADVVARIAAQDETLTHLFEGAKTEIIEREGNQRTVRTHYTALGRDGVATFHFLFSDEGSIQFEKVCDGNVWRKLEGLVSFSELEDGTRVTLHLNGSTKTLVPEIAIRGQMQDQLEQMTDALRKRIEENDER